MAEKDTTKLKETLRENLPEDNEMKLLETNSSSPKNVKVRIVRNKNNTVTTVYSESDEEIRILGKTDLNATTAVTTAIIAVLAVTGVASISASSISPMRIIQIMQPRKMDLWTWTI